jgi:selenocysteine lyase/cysteine desulfurase
VQLLLLSATLSNFAVGLPELTTIEPLWWITATTTISSGLLYLDGSGRAKITRHVKDTMTDTMGPSVRAVSDRVGPRVRAVTSRVGAAKNRVKDMLSSHKHKRR